MIRRTFLALALLGFVGGCASSPAQIRAGFDPWLGQSTDRLIAVWGPPHAVFPLPSGGAVYSWISQSAPTTTTQTFYYPAIRTSQSNTYTEGGAYCRVDWTTNERAIIVAYRWDGSCRIVSR